MTQSKSIDDLADEILNISRNTTNTLVADATIPFEHKTNEMIYIQGKCLINDCKIFCGF